MKKMLSQAFFDRPTEKVAQELLGKFLVRKIGNKEIAGMITELEVYDGPHDLASHASRGKTKRTEVMFGHPGFFYVYLIYGVHWMLNIVTREHGYPAAILIRGVEGANGPGKLTKYFKIDKTFNAKPADRQTGLWFEDRGVKIPRSKIEKTARIGVNYAGPEWKEKQLRFVLR